MGEQYKAPAVGVNHDIGRVADGVDRLVTTITFQTGKLQLWENRPSAAGTVPMNRLYGSVEVSTIADYGKNISETLVRDPDQTGAPDVPGFNECGKPANEALRSHVDMVERLIGLYAKNMERGLAAIAATIPESDTWKPRHHGDM